MATATLDASMTRLEAIKGEKHLYNKNKIAEAEALASEALRMANEAKMAAARLAEVKKTLSMFSNKLEKAEQSVQKDVKAEEIPVVAKEVTTETADAVVEEPAVADTPKEEAVEEVDDAEEDFKADPPSADVVSKSLINDDVVKVVEFKQPSPVIATKTIPKVPKEPVAIRDTPAQLVVQEKQQHDIVEDFLDGIGVDRLCGVDDKTLGFTDRPSVAPPQPEIFVNPTRLVYKTLSNEQLLHETSSKVADADRQREALELPSKVYQRSAVNEEFYDPFGVDHDDLVLCGKIADLCEPPDYEDEDFDVDASDDIRK